MIAKKYKNGNVHIIAEESDGLTPESEFYDVLASLMSALCDQCDCVILGDEYCLGNAIGMAQDMFNCHDQTIIRVPYVAVFDLVEKGRTVLHSRTPDQYDEEEIQKLFSDEY